MRQAIDLVIIARDFFAGDDITASEL